MKPAHLLIGVAMLGVAALVYLLTGDEGAARRGERDAGARMERGGGAPEEPAAEPAAGRVLVVSLRMADGSPAAGATLRARGPGGDRSFEAADGVVEWRGLAPGVYRFFAARGAAAGGGTLTVRGERNEHAIVLHEALAVSGHVYDARQRPVADALVEAVRREAVAGQVDFTKLVRRMGTPDDAAAWTRSGADGAYRLRLPGAGRYALRVSAPGYGQESTAAREFVAETDGLDFHLFGAALVLGRVTDEDGAPVAGAHVALLNMMALMSRGTPKVEGATDAEGRFSLEVSTELARTRGGTMLTARAEGFATGIASDVAVPSAGVHVALERGVEFRLRTMDADVPGKPVPGVRAVVVAGRAFVEGISGGNGDLVIDHLPTDTSSTGGRVMAVLLSDEYVSALKELRNVAPVDGVLDAGVVEMTRGGVVRGVVKDAESGEPVAGAVVQMVGGLPQQLAMVGGASAHTGEDGRFELRGVPLEATAIFARHPDYPVDPQIARELFGGRAGPGGPIFPEGSTELEKDLVLAKGETLRGVVLDPEGEPVSGATVKSEPEGGSFLFSMIGGEPPNAVTDDEGRFSLDALLAGQKLILVASHADYGASQPVAVTPGEDTSATLRLRAPVSIEGKVVDDAGDPVAGARATLSLPNRQGAGGVRRNPLAGSLPRPAITGRDGRFLLRNVPRVRGTIRISHREYRDGSKPVDPGGAADFDAGTIALESGLRISGMLTGPDGEPVVGARVMAAHRGGDGRRVARSWDETDDTGAFRFPALDAGTYEITIRAEGLHADPVEAAAGSDGVEVVAQRAGVVEGRLVDGAGGPVEGARVRADIGSERAGWATTDDRGRFRIGRLPPGATPDLTITHDEFLPLERANAAGAGVYVLDRGRALTGIVVDRAGRPVSGVRLRVQPGNRYPVTGSDGRFSASGLPRGELTVKLAGAREGYVLEAPVAVPPGESRVRVTVLRGETVSGTVAIPAGVPHQGVSLQLLDADGKSVAAEWVRGPDRSFEIRAVRPGTYTLRATRYWNEGGERRRTVVTVDRVEAGATGVAVRFGD